MAMLTVLCLVDDLYFSVQIENAARAVGLTPVGAASSLAEALTNPDLALVVMDLSTRGKRWESQLAEVRAARPDVRILAFGPHVEAPMLRAARAAGATRVVTKQQLVADLPGLLRDTVSVK
jgi:DNA-binding NarL/FixJ family response regulator